MRRGFALVAMAPALLFSQAWCERASAQLIEPVVYYHYVGGSLSWTHNVGEVPDTNFGVEAYALGGKAFTGYRVNHWLQLEAALHYLGRAPFNEGHITQSEEYAWAAAGSLYMLSPQLSAWLMPTVVPTHVFFRLGLAYKNITHNSAVASMNEGLLSGVLGIGLEYKVTPQLFVRLEYEHLTSAIGGPSHPIPGLKGLFNIDLGGTRKVVNVMHTPLSVTVGWNF